MMMMIKEDDTETLITRGPAGVAVCVCLKSVCSHCPSQIHDSRFGVKPLGHMKVQSLCGTTDKMQQLVRSIILCEERNFFPD